DGVPDISQIALNGTCPLTTNSSRRKNRQFAAYTIFPFQPGWNNDVTIITFFFKIGGQAIRVHIHQREPGGTIGIFHILPFNFSPVKKSRRINDSDIKVGTAFGGDITATEDQPQVKQRE